jgi:hypothetical protein
LIPHLAARDKENLNKNRNHQKNYFGKKIIKRNQKMYFEMHLVSAIEIA